MQLWSIEGNRQRLDGGAMFGNVPRAAFRFSSRTIPAALLPCLCAKPMADTV
jgi:hypothetical protein